MKVIIRDIAFLSRETLKALEANKTIIVIHRGSVVDLEIDDDELTRNILRELGIELARPITWKGQ